MASKKPEAESTKPKRRPILDPAERCSEILFGLIMALTFTGSLSVASSGTQDVRTMLIAAMGGSVAWGVVDAIMYLLDTLTQRGRDLVVLRGVRGAKEAQDVEDLIAEAVPGTVVSVLRPDELESIRQRVASLPDPPRLAKLERDDFRGALGVFLLVVLSTIPVVVPFLVMKDAKAALRVSNAVAILLLFFAGYAAARYSGFRPWLTGLLMVGLGAVLVAITIALGG